MLPTATRISLTDAEKLLHDGTNVHVVVMPPGPDGWRELTDETWPFGNAARWLREHGAYLAGRSAREVHHGLCSPYRDGGWVFLETRHG